MLKEISFDEKKTTPLQCRFPMQVKAQFPPKTAELKVMNLNMDMNMNEQWLRARVRV